MNQLKHFKQNRKSPDSLLILLLLCIFALSSLILVIFGANIYNSISTQRDSNFQLTTPLYYAAAKARTVDTAADVRIEEKEGVPALVLSTLDGGEPCETWIYTYEGSIYEIYLGEGGDFSMSDGTPILRDCHLGYSLEGSRLLLQTTALDGSTMRMSVTLGGDGNE